MSEGDLIARLVGRRVLIFGDVILDEYISGDCSRVSPEAPVPILHFESLRAVLGGAANTAANVASLGGNASLIGIIGDDHAGREVIQLCSRAGVELLPISDGRQTTRKVRVISQQQQLLRLDYEQSGAIGTSSESAILNQFRAAVGSTDIVVISDYAKGIVTHRVCQDAIALAHEAGKEVIVDPRPQHASHYVKCDVLTPNWNESQGLLGKTAVPINAANIDVLGGELAARFQSNILLTLGSHGIRFFSRDGGESFTIPAVAKEVFDVSGAGDTVVAAYALARAAGGNQVDSITLANRAAGIVVGKQGTATVTAGELRGDTSDGPRLLTRNDLPHVSAHLRSLNKRIVTLNGSFDVLHAGHLYIIDQAKQQGDVLIVGVNSDASIRRYKDSTRPIVAEAQRAEMLLSLRSVDYVHIFDEIAPMAFIEAVRPDVHVNGAEYGENCVEADTVKAVGARLHLVDRIDGLSTSELLRRV
jgi:D-beta-D-heptose 7-phosphate kinase/D-beta-D-heptose 1-phosphate adenosyltransferase